MTEVYDLVIIGAGPGGYEAAVEGARNGLKVAIIEKQELGGTCLNRGCIPTKTFLHVSHLYRKSVSELNADFVDFDMENVRNNIAEVTHRLRSGIEFLMKMNKIMVYYGIGTIMEPGLVNVYSSEEHTENASLRTKYILIATGSLPAIPDLKGINSHQFMTSDDFLSLNKLPENLIIIGGGIIGTEIASIYSSLGKKAIVIEALDRILPNLDRDIGSRLQAILEKKGVVIHTNSTLCEIDETVSGRLVIKFDKAGDIQEEIADAILIATGRKACISKIIASESSEEVKNIEINNKGIVVDDNYLTNIPGIYAIGDVIGGIQLAHVASAQGRCAIAHMLGIKPRIQMQIIPICVYTDPEIGCVGMSLEEAKDKNLDVKVKKYLMNTNAISVLSNQENGFIKVMFEAKGHRILGAQMMCARATDMISQFSVAIANDLVLEDITKVMFPHPTFSEGILEVCRNNIK